MGAKGNHVGQLVVETANVAELHPNPWNPNKMDTRTFAAEKESIGKFGFVDPVTVRRHPELPGQYQVIDGEHRVRAASDLGIGAVPIVVLDLADTEAKKLTVVLNETRGSADTLDLAQLLVDIGADDANLREALPYSQEQLDTLLAMANVDLPDYSPGGLADGDEGDEPWQTLLVRVPSDVAALFEQAAGRVADSIDGELSGTDEIRNGQVLEALVADYLAS